MNISTAELTRRSQAFDDACLDELGTISAHGDASLIDELSAEERQGLPPIQLEDRPETPAELKILGRIGEGGMAVVVAATQTALRRTVAVKRLKERPAEGRVLILLTDGQDTASSVRPQDAAQLAKDLGIRIYTIGIGADRMTLPGLFGSSFGSRQVNPSAELDEAGLQKIAATTGGQYFRARNPQELANIYQLLDQLEPVEQASVTYRPRQALGYVPLLLALVLSFALALRQLWLGGGCRRLMPLGGEL